MKNITAFVAIGSICACASQVTFVEQTSGLSYSGQMQDLLLEEGRVSAEIGGQIYEGTWSIDNSASSINFGEVRQSEDARVTQTTSTKITFGQATSQPDTIVAFAKIKDNSASFLALESFSGNGRMVMKSAAGDQLLCTFNPGGFDKSLRGFCTRDDGTNFDLIAAE